MNDLPKHNIYMPPGNQHADEVPSEDLTEEELEIIENDENLP